MQARPRRFYDSSRSSPAVRRRSRLVRAGRTSGAVLPGDVQRPRHVPESEEHRRDMQTCDESGIGCDIALMKGLRHVLVANVASQDRVGSRETVPGCPIAAYVFAEL